MRGRSNKVSAARGAVLVLALLLAAACGQKPNVDDDRAAAPSATDQPAGGVPAGDQNDSYSGGGETVATGGGSTSAAPAAGPTGNGTAGAPSTPASGPASPLGRAAGSSSSGGGPSAGAGSGGGSGRTTSSAAPAGGGGGGAGVPAPPSGPAAPGGSVDRTGVSDTKIRVGIHAPITGAAPFPQNAFDKGKDVYWKFLAERGGIFGRNVEIVFRDDQFNPSRAVQVCREMVEQEKVFILMGAAGSEQITACARYANSMNVPYLSAGVNEDGLAGLRELLRHVPDLHPAEPAADLRT